jgi:hypothetical protein
MTANAPHKWSCVLRPGHSGPCKPFTSQDVNQAIGGAIVLFFIVLIVWAMVFQWYG